MLLNLTLNQHHYRVDIAQAHDLCLPIDPSGSHPVFFCSGQAQAEPLQAGDFVASRRAGGSVNADVLHIVPHCQGTHSECYGHVTRQPAAVFHQVQAGLMSALLHTVTAVSAEHTSERYILGSQPDETLITRAALQQAGELVGAQALIIRTLPNPVSKRTRNYTTDPWYPVLTAEAVQYLADSPIQHFLIDTPSLDRADDGGRVYNHKTWWGIDADEQVRYPQRGLTEMIFVADKIPDGWYLLDMQIAPLISDAVPARPIIYPLIQVS